MKTIKSLTTTVKKPMSLIIWTLLLLLSMVSGSAGQTVLAKIPIPSTSNGEMAANPALNLVYSASGVLFGGTMTVIDGRTDLARFLKSTDGGKNWQELTMP